MFWLTFKITKSIKSDTLHILCLFVLVLPFFIIFLMNCVRVKRHPAPAAVLNEAVIKFVLFLSCPSW